MVWDIKQQVTWKVDFGCFLRLAGEGLVRGGGCVVILVHKALISVLKMPIWSDQEALQKKRENVRVLNMALLISRNVL